MRRRRAAPSPRTPCSSRAPAIEPSPRRRFSISPSRLRPPKLRGSRPRHASEQHGALDLADVVERAAPAEHVGRGRAARRCASRRAGCGRPSRARGRPSRCRAGSSRASVLRRSRRPCSARCSEVALGALRRGGGSRRPKAAQARARGRWRWPRPGRASAPSAPRGGAGSGASARRKPGPIRRQNTTFPTAWATLYGSEVPGDREVRVEVLARRERPLVDVHPGAERRPASPHTAASTNRLGSRPRKQAREHGAADAHRSPAGHLPDGPGALREEDVRHDRGDRAHREARHRAERVAGEQHDVGGRLDVRERGEREPPDHRQRRERGHQREHARGRLLALVPREAGRRGRARAATSEAAASSWRELRSGTERAACGLVGSGVAQRSRAVLGQQRRAAGHARHLGREVAAAAEHLARAGRRRSPRPGRAARCGRRARRRTRCRAWRPSPPRRPRASSPMRAASASLWIRSMPRVGSSSSTTAAGSPASTTSSARRWRSPPDRSRGFAVLAAGQPGAGHARHAGVLDGVLVHQVVARVLEQQRHLARALDAPARGLRQPLREPQQRALARRRCGPSARPARPGSQLAARCRAGWSGPSSTSCQTSLNTSAAERPTVTAQ